MHKVMFTRQTVESPSPYDRNTVRCNVVNCVVNVLVRIERSKVVSVCSDESERPWSSCMVSTVSAVQGTDCTSTHFPFNTNWPFSTVTKPLLYRFARVDVGVGVAAEMHLAQKATARAGTRQCNRTILLLSGQSKA